MTSNPVIRAFFDEATNTVSYLVSDPATARAAVIDPVLDFDPGSGRISLESVNAILAAAAEDGLAIEMVLETHAHADHLSAAQWIRRQTGAWIGIGRHIDQVQAIFAPVFGMDDLVPDGSIFDRLLDEGEVIALGELRIEVMHTPGHTPACVSYRIGDAVFVGDTLFMPDYGTARADFPGGDAAALYRSIRRILALPRETRLFMCHDYMPAGRNDYAWETTVGEERDGNVHIRDGVGEAEFVAMRQARDAGLAAPKLLLPSIQVNVRAGHFPPADANGTTYLRTPIRPEGEAAILLS